MLKEIHHRLIADYNCDEDIQQSSQASADSQDTMPGGAVAGGVGGAALQPQPQQQQQQQQQQAQNGSSQQRDNGKLTLPELNRLHKAFSTRGQSAAVSAQQDDSSPKPAEIPSQHRISLQLIEEWKPFKDLRQRFANTRRMEQLQLHAPQKITATVADSALRVEMEALEPEQEGAPLGACGTSRWPG